MNSSHSRDGQVGGGVALVKMVINLSVP
jgi:hypothetical protein